MASVPPSVPSSSKATGSTQPALPTVVEISGAKDNSKSVDAPVPVQASPTVADTTNMAASKRSAPPVPESEARPVLSPTIEVDVGKGGEKNKTPMVEFDIDASKKPARAMASVPLVQKDDPVEPPKPFRVGTRKATERLVVLEPKPLPMPEKEGNQLDTIVTQPPKGITEPVVVTMPADRPIPPMITTAIVPPGKQTEPVAVVELEATALPSLPRATIQPTRSVTDPIVATRLGQKPLPSFDTIQKSPVMPVAKQQPLSEKQTQPSNEANYVREGATERVWAQSLWDFDSECFAAWLCPCVTFGEVSYRMDHPEDTQGVHYDAMRNSECWSFCALGCLSPILTRAWGFMTRMDIREDLNIKGNIGTDCLAAWFCQSCALSQEINQLRQKEDRAILNKRRQRNNRQPAPVSMDYATQTTRGRTLER